jgi:hypothetical protein
MEVVYGRSIHECEQALITSQNAVEGVAPQASPHLAW